MERSDAARGKYRAVQQPIRYLVGSLPLLLAIAFLAALPGTGGCSDGRAHADPEGASARGTDVGTPEAAVSAAQDRFAARRAAMVAEQLAPGGRLVLPVGRGVQELVLIEKGADGTVTRRDVLPVRFVPMTGAAQRR